MSDGVGPLRDAPKGRIEAVALVRLGSYWRVDLVVLGVLQSRTAGETAERRETRQGETGLKTSRLEGSSEAIYR